MTVPEVQAPSSCGTLLTQPTKQAAEAHPSPVSEQWGLTRSPVKSRQHLLLRVDGGLREHCPSQLACPVPAPSGRVQSALAQACCPRALSATGGRGKCRIWPKTRHSAQPRPWPPRATARLGDTCPRTEPGRGALGHGVAYTSDKGMTK